MALENEHPTQRILLVESNEITQDVLHEEMEAELGCEVTALAHGMRALEEVLARRFTLVVSSTRVPGLDGIDLLRRMRTYPQTAPIPFLVVAVTPSLALERQLEEVKSERGGGAVEVVGKTALEPVLKAAEQLLDQCGHSSEAL